MNILELEGAWVHDNEQSFCSFCGAGHEECAELVIGPGKNICTECLVECQKRIQSYRDTLPTPKPAAMQGMSTLMEVVAAFLKNTPVCPWCHATDLAYEVVDLGVGQPVQATAYSCSCGGIQFSPGVLEKDVTCEEWDKQWHAPQGYYDMTFADIGTPPAGENSGGA